MIHARAHNLGHGWLCLAKPAARRLGEVLWRVPGLARVAARKGMADARACVTPRAFLAMPAAYAPVRRIEVRGEAPAP